MKVIKLIQLKKLILFINRSLLKCLRIYNTENF